MPLFNESPAFLQTCTLTCCCDCLQTLAFYAHGIGIVVGGIPGIAPLTVDIESATLRQDRVDCHHCSSMVLHITVLHTHHRMYTTLCVWAGVGASGELHTEHTIHHGNATFVECVVLVLALACGEYALNSWQTMRAPADCDTRS